MKNLLLKGKNGLFKILKRIPAKVYVLLIFSLIALSLQIMLYKPFMEMADSSLKFYSEYDRHRTHKSQDEELLAKLMEEDQKIRDKYLVVDMEAHTNIFEKLETSIVSSFATIDSLVAQFAICLVLFFPHYLLLKHAILLPIAIFFSKEKRNQRKALKGNKVKLLAASNEKAEVTKPETKRRTAKKRVSKHAAVHA